jgi:hypothetical protein
MKSRTKKSSAAGEEIIIALPKTLKGKRGHRGNDGPPGDTGASGLQGIQGLPGRDGNTGAQGNPGINIIGTLYTFSLSNSTNSAILNCNTAVTGFNECPVNLGALSINDTWTLSSDTFSLIVPQGGLYKIYYSAVVSIGQLINITNPVGQRVLLRTFQNNIVISGSESECNMITSNNIGQGQSGNEIITLSKDFLVNLNSNDAISFRLGTYISLGSYFNPQIGDWYGANTLNLPLGPSLSINVIRLT